ncbi:MAG TPA: HDOD domain-containing protein, partial [Planctomycetaceae bacterium]|nr:HDOD domain-containing protein [Planctomycetaceae bacterium]
MLTVGYRALVVDDEPIARKMLTGALEQEGFACDAATDGIQALRLIMARKYDLVVTDLRMPNKHGHALALDLLAAADRPVIMIHTAVDEPRLTEDLLVRGVDDIVYKPTNYATLAVRAKVLVERRRNKSADGNPRTFNADAIESDRRTSSLDGANVVGAISEAELDRRLSDVSEVLPISETALNAYRVATEEDVATSEIARAIAGDAALTADVLRTGNSGHYNRSGNRTADLEQLIARVGRRRIGELALAASVRSVVTGQQIPWLNAELAWKRSVGASIAMDELIKHGKYQSVEQGLFLSALMHPLGRTVLATIFPKRHETLTRRAKEDGEALRQAEKRLVSLTHAEIMAKLLGRWRIPADVTSPLTHALDSFPLDKSLPEKERMRCELLKLAIIMGRLAVGLWEPWDLVEIPPSSVLKRLGIRSFPEIIAETRTKVQELTSKDMDLHHFDSPEVNSVTRSVGYWNPSSESCDFFRELFPAVGVAPVCGGLEAEEVVIANCLDCDPSEFSRHLDLRGLQNVVVITTESKRRQFAGACRVVALPTSFGRLRETMRHTGAEAAGSQAAR